jgi:hypothetical protein
MCHLQDFALNFQTNSSKIKKDFAIHKFVTSMYVGGKTNGMQQTERQRKKSSAITKLLMT